MELTHREKAAVIAGMVRAFESVAWPEHFNDDDRSSWQQKAVYAAQMLGDGVFEPQHAWAVVELFDDEFSEI